MKKPYSSACERNRDPILEVLKKEIGPKNRRLLEIGSGTGQHAIYFAPHFSHVEWVLSDRASQHLGIKMWLKESKAKNITGPIRFEVGRGNFPRESFDLIFTANTFHILSWKECKTLMKMWARRLRKGAKVMIYGPFKYNGDFTSESNREFDLKLKDDHPQRGIRAFEDINWIMIKNGFLLHHDYEMPANNRMLVYIREEHVRKG